MLARRVCTTVPIARARQPATPKKSSRETLIEEQSERDRAQHRAEVQPGVDETIHPAGGALGGRIAHDQVARGPCRPERESDDRDQRQHDGYCDAHRHHRDEQQCRDQQARCRNAVVARRLRREESSDENPGGASQKIGGQCRRRERQRHAEARVERARHERLQAHAGHRLDHEVREAQQDGGLDEKRDAARERVQMRIVGPARDEQRAARRSTRPTMRSAPPPARPGAERRAAQRKAHHRRERIAEIAADAVRAVRVAEAARRDVGIENREIGGVKHAVAHTHQRDDREQPRDAGRETRERRPAGEQCQAGQQYRSRPEAVHREAGGELRDVARGVVDADLRCRARVTDAELRPQQRKQRRQRQLEEMRERCARPMTSISSGVATQRIGVGKSQRRGRHGGDRGD